MSQTTAEALRDYAEWDRWLKTYLCSDQMDAATQTAVLEKVTTDSPKAAEEYFTLHPEARDQIKDSDERLPYVLHGISRDIVQVQLDHLYEIAREALEAQNDS